MCVCARGISAISLPDSATRVRTSRRRFKIDVIGANLRYDSGSSSETTVRDDGHFDNPKYLSYTALFDPFCSVKLTLRMCLFFSVARARLNYCKVTARMIIRMMTAIVTQIAIRNNFCKIK